MKVIVFLYGFFVAMACQASPFPPDGFSELKDSEPRVSSLGFSFVPPSGEKWFEGFGPKKIMYLKQTNPVDLSFIAIATEMKVEKPVSSQKDLLDYVKSNIFDSSKKPSRYKNIVDTVEIENSTDSYCVIYKQVMEDHKAKNLNGNKYLILTNKGMLCVSLENSQNLVLLFYSARATPNLNFPFIVKEGEEFIKSLKFIGTSG